MVHGRLCCIHLPLGDMAGHRDALVETAGVVVINKAVGNVRAAIQRSAPGHWRSVRVCTLSNRPPAIREMRQDPCWENVMSHFDEEEAATICEANQRITVSAALFLFQ